MIPQWWCQAQQQFRKQNMSSWWERRDEKSVFLQNDNKKLLPISISTDAFFPMCFVPSNCLGFARRIFHADNKQQHKTFHPEKKNNFQNLFSQLELTGTYASYVSGDLFSFTRFLWCCEGSLRMRNDLTSGSERWKSVPISITIEVFLVITHGEFSIHQCFTMPKHFTTANESTNFAGRLKRNFLSFVYVLLIPRINRQHRNVSFGEYAFFRLKRELLLTGCFLRTFLLRYELTIQQIKQLGVAYLSELVFNFCFRDVHGCCHVCARKIELSKGWKAPVSGT